jgi:hypothetical protein
MAINVVPIVHKTGTHDEAFLPYESIWTELVKQELRTVPDATQALLRLATNRQVG